MQARYYDPVIGRFYSNDPVDAASFISQGNIHGFNRYVYGNNNPYKYIDPDGRKPTWNFVNRTQKHYSVMQKSKGTDPKPNEFSAGGHGSETSFLPVKEGTPFTYRDAKSFLKDMRKNGFTGKESRIKLYVCHAGSDRVDFEGNKVESFAQELANETGIEVEAANNLVTIEGDNVSVENGGKFIVFKPEERIENKENN